MHFIFSFQRAKLFQLQLVLLHISFFYFYIFNFDMCIFLFFSQCISKNSYFFVSIIVLRFQSTIAIVSLYHRHRCTTEPAKIVTRVLRRS